MTRRILFVTGIRSEYDILHSVMTACRARGLDVGVAVTGAHLSPLYGLTVREIERDRVPIVARIESLLNSDSRAGRVKSAAIQLSGLVDLMGQWGPDFVVAPMDREEAITVALAGAYLRVPVAHIGGGDTAEDGNIDNAIRHAATKLAHLHFVTTRRSRERVVRLGEEPWRIHVVGAPGLDKLLATSPMTREAISEALHHDLRVGPYLLVIQHSILTEDALAAEQMRTTLDAVVASGLPAVVIKPNSDAGSQSIIEVIDEYAAREPTIAAYTNLPRDVFVNLLRHAYALVGNSSCGIIEAPLFHVPVVNVGSRQLGRENAGNVQFVPHERDAILRAIEKAVSDKDYRDEVARCENPYGDGRTGERIADVLSTVPVDARLLNKINTF